jgi:hypothetical protein
MFCCVSVLIVMGSMALSQSKPNVSVSLTTPRPEYVIGEPILLKVIIKNTSAEAVTAVWAEEYADIFLSEDGKNFDRYTNRRKGDPIPFLFRKPETLQPNGSRTIDKKVLYSSQHPSGLAVEKSQTLFVQARYTLSQGSKIRWFESEAVQIRVNEPEGTDKQVWQTMQGEEFIYFLHHSRASNDKAVAKAIAVLQKFPTSAYHPMIRDALRKHYEESKFNRAKREEVKQIRAVLGIKELLFPEDLFSDDKRLDTKVVLDFPEFTSSEKVLDSLSKQSGIPLDASANIKQHRMKCIRMTVDLRSEMFNLIRLMKASWTRRGDGYFLSKEKDDDK